MAAPSVLLRGEGWKLASPLDVSDPLEVWSVPSHRPDLLPDLLRALDGIAASGRPEDLAVGFLTYEAGVALEGSTSLCRPPATPLAWFARFDTSCVSGLRDRDHPGPRTGPSAPGAGETAPPREGVDDLDLRGWRAGVDAIRDAIARGDVYQVNLTRRIERTATVAPRLLAGLLDEHNPVPYALCLEAGGFAVVSNSPELFLDVDLERGTVASAPIKGTVPLRLGGSEEAAVRGLLASEKDAAEHVMIVDLVRNDLARVCRPGSVHVPDFRRVRSFRHLHHLESTVAGRLVGGARLSDILRATVPGGSITGAPKRASLAFIRRLEPVPRGPYTGAAGYVRGDGTAVFSVAIRTAILGGGTAAYHTGGGIVWDSDPLAEWEETETKSREFFGALDDLAAAEARE